MSWSISAKGNPAEVKAELDRQFSYPLAEVPHGIEHDGERQTVRKVFETITQCLETFDKDRLVSVSASGHISFSDYDTKAGAGQTVSISIIPG